MKVKAPGRCALQPGDGRVVTLAQLRMAGVEGLTIRYTLKTDRKFIEQCIGRCRQTDVGYTLLCMSGDSREPWRETAVYQNLAAVMGGLYGDDPLCRGVHVTGCTPYGTSEEQHWKVTPEIDAANRRLITAYSASFKKQAILFAGAGDDPAGMRKLIDFGVKAAPGRFLFKNNALKANTQITAPHNQLVIYAGKQGAGIGWELVGSTLESRFGGTWEQAMAKAAEISKLAGQPVDYLGTYPPDLKRLKAK